MEQEEIYLTETLTAIVHLSFILPQSRIMFLTYWITRNTSSKDHPTDCFPSWTDGNLWTLLLTVVQDLFLKVQSFIRCGCHWQLLRISRLPWNWGDGLESKTSVRIYRPDQVTTTDFFPWRTLMHNSGFYSNLVVSWFPEIGIVFIFFAFQMFLITWNSIPWLWWWDSNVYLWD